MNSPRALFEVRDLAVVRGGTEVLRVPSFSLFEQETLALIGPNGTGKTSFLLALAGLIPLASGEMHFQGEPVNLKSSATGFRRKLAMVFQEPLLFDATVYANVAAGLKIRGLSGQEMRKRVDTCLERFRISHLAERSARKLSGGEAQRTSLARAFATEPHLVLLDEPFSSLDPPTRQALGEDLEQMLRESGASAIMSTHDQADALRLADRLMVMQQGKIVQTGTPAEVMNRPANEFVANFVGMENIFSGEVREVAGSLLSISVGERVMEIPGDAVPGDRVVFCIHPEHVLITTADPDRTTSARNVMAGTVVRIVPFGLFNKVYINCGIGLVAAITNQSLSSLALQQESRVFASFKATAAHLFRTSHH